MTSPQLDLPASVRLEPGRGGLTVVRVAGAAGSAEVYLHGAHVTAWSPAGAGSVSPAGAESVLPAGAESALWLSSASTFAAGAAIRGGVPICFPWFGPLAGVPAAPKHGFARIVDWTLAQAREDGDDVVLALELGDSEATRSSAWPHRFAARYTITVGARLTLSLTVVNPGPEVIVFEEALHTYLGVGDVGATEVRGLEGVPFFDKPRAQERPGEAGPVRFAAETDRVYGSTAAATTVVDGARGRSVRIEKLGSRSTVVWNPGRAQAAAMADVGVDEWRRMVCVEAGNVGAEAIELAPGASHTLSATFAVG